MQSSYATDHPGEAEEFLGRAYSVGVRLSLPRQRNDFRLAVGRLDAGSFQLDEMDLAARSMFRYQPDQEYFISAAGRGRLRVLQAGEDETFGPGEVALIGRPGVETRNLVDDFRQSVVTLRVAALRDAAGLDPEGTETPQFTSVRAISQRHIRAWCRAVGFARATLSDDPAVAEAPLVLGSVERLLAGLALSTFPTRPALSSSRREELDARSPATLRRAVVYIEANAARDISIGEIAGAARVTRRAVQQAFRRHLDTTPTAYLRQVRLDAARRELLAAEPGALTVTEVAHRWGFSSPSRFTERYRAAFGTTPSETLRR